MKKFYIISFLILFLAGNLSAQTNVSGALSSDTTWSLSNSPIILTGNVLVPNGVTLTIEAGVTVRINSEKYLKVQGSLIAIGTESSKITFTSNESSPAKGDWDKIWLASTSTLFDGSDNYVSGTIFNHCIISYADEGLRLDDSSFYLVNSELTENNKGINFRKVISSVIDNNNFNNNGSGTSTSAGTEDNGVGSFTFTKFLNNTFKNNTGDGLSFGGYRNNANNNLIKNNISINNGGNGFYFGWGDVVRGFADNTIEGNIIYNNSGNGITVGRDSNIIKKNFIVNNEGSGINISGTYIYEGLTIENNIISGNLGYGLDLTSNTNSLIRYNSILNSGGNSENPSLGIPNSYIISNNNTITYNTIYASENSAIELRYGPNTFNNNNFISTKGNYIFKLLTENNSDINAENNYWGTSTESEIQSVIYDYSDDFELGAVDYTPFLTSPNTDAPISPPSNVTKSVSGSDVVLNWSTNGESDIAGYKLYYGDPTGYSYSIVIDLGNVTTYTVTGGEVATEYAITAYDTSLDGTDDMVDGNESWYSKANTLPELPTNIVLEGAPRKSKLSWTLSASDNVSGYKIFRGTSANPTILLTTLSNTTTSYTDNNLDNEAIYYYTIKTVDNNEVESNFSQDYITTPTNTWYVSNTSQSEGFGSNINPYNNIQSAINASISGEIVLVSNGTYQENIDLDGKDITLTSLFMNTQNQEDINSTIIDGNNNGAVISIFNSESSLNLIEGFKIINGNGRYADASMGVGYYGGGIYIKDSSPTIRNCIISNNNSENGGGIYANNSQSLFDKLQISQNNQNQSDVPFGGGGMYLDSFNGIIKKTTVSDNVIPYSDFGGGGILLFGGNAQIKESQILNNHSENYGSGISIYASSELSIENSIISNNTSGDGNQRGGIHSDNCNFSLKSSVIWGNKDGVSINGSPNIEMENSIIYGNEIEQINGGFVDYITIKNSNIQNGWPGNGNIDNNPYFTDPFNNDFHLENYSQCIGTGGVEEIPLYDIEYSSRPNPTGSSPDMGAYENPLGIPVNAPPTIDQVENIFINEDSEEQSINLFGISDGDILTDQILTISYTNSNQSLFSNFSINYNSNSTTGSLVFTPIQNAFGDATITLIVQDDGGVSEGGQDTQTISFNVTINPINDGPVANDQNVLVNEGATTDVLDNNETNLLYNAVDVDQDELSAILVTAPSNGSLTLNLDGTFTYTHDGSETTSDGFTYKVNDGLLDSNIATVTITINPVNDAPVVSNHALTVDEGGIATILDNSESSLLFNASDIEEDSLTAILETEPNNGTLVLNADGTFIYTHDGSDILTDSFTYRADDSDLTSEIGTVSITINPLNDNIPTDINLSNNLISENQDSANGFIIGQFTTIDLDLPSDTHTFELVNGDGDTNNNSFIVEGNNLKTFTSFDFETQESLSIRVKTIDEVNQSFEKVFTINIININDISIESVVTNSYCEGDTSNGSITISEINNTSGDLTFSWSASNGGFIPVGQENNQNLTDLKDGTFTVIVSDATNFTLTEVFQITLIPQYSDLSVCYVTSDEEEPTKNRIFINNEGNYNVSSYEVLRETNTANVYDVIGSIDPNMSSFLDNNSNNNSQEYRYKVRLVDLCGNTSQDSELHKTILLQSSISVNNNINLSWTDYEGADVPSYNIYRKINNENYELLAEISSNSTSYNDQTTDTSLNSYEYYIAVQVNDCNIASSESSSRNGLTEIKSNRQQVGDSSLSLDELDFKNSISIFPNPATNTINITINSNTRYIKSEVYNILSQRILETNKKSISIENLSKSTYFLKIFTEKGILIKKFIKN